MGNISMLFVPADEDFRSEWWYTFSEENYVALPGTFWLDLFQYKVYRRWWEGKSKCET
jgi:hypothetical protein